MIFSIYQLREDPDWCIFDRELSNPRIGEANEYDCAGVFQVEAGAQISVLVSPWIPEDPGPTVVLGKLDAWRLTAAAIRRGDFTDKDSGQTAHMMQLWP